ncbi:MAG: serpin family protein [Clostridiales bacterium]|mgnify:CR=1 FL=1|nr:serpin family protein [Clostridiales bacterium]
MSKKLFLILTILILGLVLVACGTISGEEQQTPGGNESDIGGKDLESDDIKDITYDLEKLDAKLVNGSQRFAFDIFQKLSEEDSEESIFISPLSISQALTMTYNGAEGRTREEMENALGFSGISRDVVNESYMNLNNYLARIDDKIMLNIGNSIWIREGEDVNEEFIKTNEVTFSAEVETIDFSDSTAADTINSWISGATNGMIDKMISPPIPRDVLMYLINAIYFKGEWSEQFDPKLTYEDNFTTIDGTVQKANMMVRPNSSVEYTGNDEYKAVRLPYGNGKTSMYIILPEEGSEINEFISEMTLSKWSGIKKTVSETEDIVFRIPKFKLEYGIKELNDSLKALGMEEAFASADLSGIRDDIFISSVIHKAVIEVNEEGSEAAAVTVVETKCTALAEPLTFIVNRPFMFIINDDVTDTILFMGKVVSIKE